VSIHNRGSGYTPIEAGINISDYAGQEADTNRRSGCNATRGHVKPIEAGKATTRLDYGQRPDTLRPDGHANMSMPNRVLDNNFFNRYGYTTCRPWTHAIRYATPTEMSKYVGQEAGTHNNRASDINKAGHTQSTGTYATDTGIHANRGWIRQMSDTPSEAGYVTVRPDSHRRQCHAIRRPDIRHGDMSGYTGGRTQCHAVDTRQ
jgi:hypothetical protein